MNVEMWGHGSFWGWSSLSSVIAVSAACAKSLQKVWEGLCWGGMWPFLDPLDVVGLRTTASIWNVPKKHGPPGELFFFFFLVKKELVFVREMVDFGHCVPAETLKACALIGLLTIADEVSGAELALVGRSVCLNILCLLRNEGVLSFRLCAFVVYMSSQKVGRKVLGTTFRSRSEAPVGKSGFAPFNREPFVEGDVEASPGSFPFL